MTSRLNDLKSQHIATEVTGIDNKTKKNASDILTLENKLKQKEDTINENERGLSFNRGFFYYLQQNHYVYECKSSSFDITVPANSIYFKINTWKSTGILSSSSSDDMIAVKNASGDLPKLGFADYYYVNLSGKRFQQK